MCVFFLLQLALPQLVAGAQFPFNFATGAAAAPHMAGFYYPHAQPMAAAQAAAAQTNYLQGLQGYTFNNFGASFPQGYIRYLQYGNTGCGVFTGGIQNWKGFCLKINCIPMKITKF